MPRILLREIAEHFVEYALLIAVLLVDLSRRKQFQHLAKGLLIRVCLGFYIKDECHQQHARRCIPERVLRLTALGGCCLEQVRDKPLYIVIALGIEKRIVAHGLLHVDEIKNPHFIPL